MTEAEIADNIDVLEKIVRKLRSQQMPPGGHKMPDKTTRTQFIGWLEGKLDKAGEEHEDPGHVGLHRLNRKEYANAVRDLLGIEIDPADILPRDEPREGFDNIAAALQVTPSFLDQYIAAARTVVVQALGNKDALPAGTTYRAQKPSHADLPPGWPAAGHARRHRRGPQLPGRRRVRAEHRQHGAGAVGLQHGVRERPGRHARRQARVRNLASAAKKT